MNLLSRQRRWQLIRQAQGKCVACGRKATHGTRCEECQTKVRDYSLLTWREARGIPLDTPPLRKHKRRVNP